MDLNALIRKYNQPGPRYTSYPTAPQWSTTVTGKLYEQALHTTGLAGANPVAMYIHIPFCESLCYYCGCNIEISKKRIVGIPYVDAMLKEAVTVTSRLQQRACINHMSWGGGTPTYLPCDEIERLYNGIRSHFDFTPEAEVSIEVNPRVTTEDQLVLLARLGFNRISLGVQDFDPKVQKAVHRGQSALETEAMLRRCRELGFEGINFDLIYGLPYQTARSFEQSIEDVIRMGPDRIALYHYAHLPELRPHQKILEKYPMPDDRQRVEIFTVAYHNLTQAGYVAIGMDHFATPSDELARALPAGKLHRNFMGYASQHASDLIGIGASAIGEVGGGYFQNLRESKGYQLAIGTGGLATFRGCVISEEDRRRKWVIQNLMCAFQLSFEEYEGFFQEPFDVHFAEELNALEGFYEDEILEKAKGFIKVTPLGRLFIRNAAMVFDAYLPKSGPKLCSIVHSQTV